MKKRQNNRRQFLKNMAFAGVGSMVLSSNLFADTPSGNTETVFEPVDDFFSLPALGYGYEDLEPHIDTLTMQIHHSRHHQGYVNNLNKAMKENNLDAGLDELIRRASTFPTSIRNNGGGHWNHSFFWKIMKPNGGGNPGGKLAEAINGSFGSFDKFKAQFQDTAMKRFGSGWAWLVKNDEGKLEIGSTPNQDNPLMDLSDFKGTPLLGIDVWEHAYYLHYQNKRADYITAWWNVVNWEEVASRI